MTTIAGGSAVRDVTSRVSKSGHGVLTSWIVTLLVALFGGFLRFFRLGTPHSLVFDETYYVKDAWSMLRTGEARDWPKELPVDGVNTPIDALFASGDTDLWLDAASYVVHPPVGKWFIALGLWLFGGANNPFAWRAATAIAGTVAIILIIRVALRLFHNLSIALLAGLLLSVDGMGIVMSRTSLLDNFLMVLVLAAFLLLLMHRDWAQRRLEAQFAVDSCARYARWIPARDSRWNSSWLPSWFTRLLAAPRTHRDLFRLDARGPTIALSWWRVGAAVLLGLATGVKWSGAYFFAVFCVISVCWDAWQRHKVGYSSWFSVGLLRGGFLAALYMIPLWTLAYVAGWANWFIHPDSYMRHWAESHPGEGVTWLPSALRSFVEYHRQMWDFHTHLETTHNYMANPLTWPLQIRPTSFYWEKVEGNGGLCALAPESECVRAITSLGNPLIWWLGSACVVIGIAVAVVRRGDWRIWAVLAGFLGGWLPWAQYLNRTTFTFYAIVILPWVVLAICYVADWLRGRVSAFAWHVTVWSIVAVIALVSVFFYPIWTAIPVPYEFWHAHMWLDSWI